MKLKKSIKRDLPVLQEACEKILKRFPNAPIQLYWWHLSESFAITTDDRELYESQEYKELQYELYDYFLKHVGHRVDFFDSPLQEDGPRETDCIEFEIPSLTKKKQRKVALVQ